MVSAGNLLGANRDRLARLAAAGLVLAGLIVGVAIALDGTAARAVNGAGGILWIASGVLLVSALRHREHWKVLAPVTLGVGLVLSYVVRPSDIVMASIGFLAGGIVVASVARKPMLASLILPASWLPLHLFLAITRSVYREMTGGESVVRTDPPPTAALVPFTMIVAAAVGGFVISQLRASKSREPRVSSYER